ncbi:MAG: glycosyltransferase family 4 protein [Propionibacteriaceae bacterium]|nr:glycosyltransferase family 4 protein [Propionibacteriaceae bacterium]
MRVGLVCPYSFDTPGGVQNQVRGLAGYLRADGHEPHILAPGDYVSTDGRSAEDDFFTSAGATVPVRYNGSTARVNFGPLSSARVRRWLRRGDFDLVHIHEPVTPSISMLALWAAEVPVVATFHTATPRSRSMQLAGGALRAAIEKIDAGIAVSESARKVVVQHLGRDAVVVPNGFWYRHFQPTPRPGKWRGGSRPRLTFLGRRDEPRKGLDVLLRALPRIRASFGDLDVVVAGRGSCDLPAGCRALGPVSDAQKAAILATSDVFVAPHLERESFGIVLLEAMASGAPVVASDLPAFCDILAGEPPDGDLLGSTFPVGDAAALATSVIEGLSDPPTARIVAARRASRRYDWTVVGAATAEVYRATCAVARLESPASASRQ